MKFIDLFERYIFNDGRIISFHADFEKRECQVEIHIRQIVSNKKYESCNITLLLNEVFEVYISEDFSSGWYSDITFIKIDQNTFYLSMDPFGNSGIPHERDNLIIKARKLRVLDTSGVQHEVN